MKEIKKTRKQTTRKRISRELQSLKIPTPEELAQYEKVAPGSYKEIIKLRSDKINARSKNFEILMSFLKFLLKLISSIMFYHILKNLL